MKIRFTNPKHRMYLEITPKRTADTKGVSSCLIPFDHMLAIGQSLCPSRWCGCSCFKSDEQARGLTVELVRSGGLVSTFDVREQEFDLLFSFLKQQPTRRK